MSDDAFMLAAVAWLMLAGLSAIALLLATAWFF